MYKNFSPQGLGITGRQSELIELALTYAFRGIEVDMIDMLKRTQRTDFQDASKYLRASDIKIGGFDAGINLDADDETFTAQLGQLHPVTDVASQLKAKVATVRLPAATDRLPYHEYFDTVRGRLQQIAEVLEGKGIRLGIAFQAGKELLEKKQFPFVTNVEGFKALVKAVPSENVGYVIDTWNWRVGEGSMEQLQEIPASKIVSVRLGDVAASVELAEAKTSDRVLPTTGGAINHVALVKHLSTGGYKGPIGPTAAAAQYKGQTRETIVNKAQEAIDEILREAGLHVSPRPMDTIQQMPYEPTATN